MSIHKVDLNNLIVSKLTEEVNSIDETITSLENNKRDIETKLSENRKELANLEKTLYELGDYISILKENKLAIKQKIDNIKKAKE